MSHSITTNLRKSRRNVKIKKSNKHKIKNYIQDVGICKIAARYSYLKLCIGQCRNSVHGLFDGESWVCHLTLETQVQKQVGVGPVWTESRSWFQNQDKIREHCIVTVDVWNILDWDIKQQLNSKSINNTCILYLLFIYNCPNLHKLNSLDLSLEALRRRRFMSWTYVQLSSIGLSIHNGTK